MLRLSRDTTPSWRRLRSPLRRRTSAGPPPGRCDALPQRCRGSPRGVRRRRACRKSPGSDWRAGSGRSRPPFALPEPCRQCRLRKGAGIRLVWVWQRRRRSGFGEKRISWRNGAGNHIETAAKCKARWIWFPYRQNCRTATVVLSFSNHFRTNREPRRAHCQHRRDHLGCCWLVRVPGRSSPELCCPCT